VSAALSHVERRFHALSGLNTSTVLSPSSRHEMQVVVGTFADYRALARFHYIAGKPATHVRVLCIRDPLDDQPFGVLVVSMPTLDGSWRELAWPGRYRSHDRAAAARRINRELRTISRVIIDPRYRALGLARTLVKAYLADPLSPATEAIAAMGAASPFFKAAGMHEYRLPEKPADIRLRDAMHACGIAPSSLCRPACAQRLLESPLLTKELRLWSRSRKNKRKLEAIGQIIPYAAKALLSDPRAYAHTHVPCPDK
jgi:hypothetical protein